MPHMAFSKDVEKPVLQCQIDRELVKIRDIFVRTMSRNSYEPEDADTLDRLLEQAYRSGKIAGIKYALDGLKKQPF